MIVGTLLAGHRPYSFAVYFLSGAFLLAALLILSLRLPREVQ
jgi:hypothetical protein